MGPQPQAQGWPEGCQPLSVQQAGRWPAIPQMPAPVRALASMRVQVQAQMQQPDFAKAYYDARLERIFTDMLESLKEKIVRNAPQEQLLRMIDSFQQQIQVRETA